MINEIWINLNFETFKSIEDDLEDIIEEIKNGEENYRPSDIFAVFENNGVCFE